MTKKFVFAVIKREVAEAVVYADDAVEATRMVEDMAPDELHWSDAVPACVYSLVSESPCGYDDAINLIVDLMHFPREELNDEVYLKLQRIKDCLKGGC